MSDERDNAGAAWKKRGDEVADPHTELVTWHYMLTTPLHWVVCDDLTQGMANLRKRHAQELKGKGRKFYVCAMIVDGAKEDSYYLNKFAPHDRAFRVIARFWMESGDEWKGK